MLDEEKAVKATASTTSPAANAEANTRLLPLLAVTSVPTTCFTPFKNTSTCPAVYASVCPAASEPVTVVGVPVILNTNLAADCCPPSEPL